MTGALAGHTGKKKDVKKLKYSSTQPVDAFLDRCVAWPLTQGGWGEKCSQQVCE